MREKQTSVQQRTTSAGRGREGESEGTGERALAGIESASDSTDTALTHARSLLSRFRLSLVHGCRGKCCFVCQQQQQ